AQHHFIDILPTFFQNVTAISPSGRSPRVRKGRHSVTVRRLSNYRTAVTERHAPPHGRDRGHFYRRTHFNNRAKCSRRGDRCRADEKARILSTATRSTQSTDFPRGHCRCPQLWIDGGIAGCSSYWPCPCLFADGRLLFV